MAVRTKAQLHSDIAGLPSPVTVASLTTVLDNMVDSYEDIIQSYTSAQIGALTPTTGDIVYNTDTQRLQVFEAAEWVAISPQEQTLIDCSANPDYPEGLVQDIYYVQNAGKIGGASGKTVYVGDLIFCIAQNDGGNEATVGGSWKVVRVNTTDSIILTPIPTWFKVASKTFTDLSAAATTNNISIYTLPIRGFINDVRILRGTAFSGGAIASYSMSVGIVGALEKYQAGLDVFTGSTINVEQDNKTGIESISATTDIRLSATSTGANLNAATAGTVDIFLLLSTLPS